MRFRPTVVAIALGLVACGQSHSGDPGAGGSAARGSAGDATTGGGGSDAGTGGGSGNGAGAGSSSGAGLGGGSGSGAGSGSSAGSGASAGAATGGGPILLGSPLVFAPTLTGVGLSVVLSAGDPASLGVRVRVPNISNWGERAAPLVRAVALAEWHLDGLIAGTRYEYEVVTGPMASEVALYAGSFVTERKAGDAFSFALLSDTHIGADPTFSNQGDTAVLTATSAELGAAAPDFVVNLGDMLDFHEYGFNVPPPDSSIARAAYLNYRAGYGAPLGNFSHFFTLGGWDSESGCNTVDEIERSRSQRLLYLPAPTPDTYPQGGSPFEDYYAFTWGDALFVMLNVYTYTPGCHLLDTYPGLADDWTLGDAQLAWLRTTLENATSKWRFLLIHHPVGGNAGDDVESAYGRGGGRAAHVGEQEIVHELMQEHGVQSMFYGHDHVFTDMVVDDIHYSLPGSAGAIWFFTEEETGYPTAWPDSGWARVDVTPDDVHVQFLATGGGLLYDYTLE